MARTCCVSLPRGKSEIVFDSQERLSCHFQRVFDVHQRYEKAAIEGQCRPGQGIFRLPVEIFNSVALITSSTSGRLVFAGRSGLEVVLVKLQSPVGSSLAAFGRDLMTES